ncbi:MAG TPA: tetratricopeptide repeat protein [Armatimonadota bacterium]|nr:tetratricopeptide repeat protein [Armatimonadota bacterium]
MPRRWCAAGRDKGAQEHYQRALRIFQHFLGDDHPHTKGVRRNLESLGP